jgi:hypothetical protein
MITNMRKFIVSGLTAVLLLAASPAQAKDAPAHPFGLGLELGSPTGLSFKYYLGKSARGTLMALQFGLGVVERYGEDGLNIHGELLWHPAVLARTPDFTLPFYLGGGLRFLDHRNDSYCFRQGNDVICVDANDFDDDFHIGARVPFGLLMDFHKVSLDVFFEMAMVVDFVRFDNDNDSGVYEYDHDVVTLNGSLGVRYYF